MKDHKKLEKVPKMMLKDILKSDEKHEDEERNLRLKMMPIREIERDLEIAGFEEQRKDVQEAKEAELADISHQRKISTSPTAVLPGYEVASSNDV